MGVLNGGLYPGWVSSTVVYTGVYLTGVNTRVYLTGVNTRVWSTYRFIPGCGLPTGLYPGVCTSPLLTRVCVPHRC